MELPVRPPVKPMLCALSRELPSGDYVFEPKWDGFRCLAFCGPGEVDLRSRNGRPFTRYFPELLPALSELRGLVLDGELVIATRDGFDFDALLARLHPAASRVELLSRESPAMFIAFDLLAARGRDLRDRPFVKRRELLERELAAVAGQISVTPATRDPVTAGAWLERFEGVVAKDPQLRYIEGRRAMLKVKRERTLDCVVGGFRVFAAEPLPSSLLLGLYDDGGTLRHIGVASSFARKQREQLLEALRPFVCGLRGHPWERGFLVEGSRMGRMRGAAARWVPGEMEQDWTAVQPTLVCEIGYDHLDEDRLRHPARFRRWRPDRDARSCTFAQLERRSWPEPAPAAA
jgi:ATP-dependent DNA ligase